MVATLEGLPVCSVPSDGCRDAHAIRPSEATAHRAIMQDLQGRVKRSNMDEDSVKSSGWRQALLPANGDDRNRSASPAVR